MPSALSPRSLQRILSVVAFLLFSSVSPGQEPDNFASRVQSIMARPEFKHAMFGLETYSLDTQRVLFGLNGDKLFTPGSTTKLLTAGTALELLGANYRFHTFVYRTGPIDSNGVLQGDLVLVGSGDPNLSNRVQPDGTLAFENVDHSYGGHGKTKAVPGDPLKVIRIFADQISAKGVKEVKGRVTVDARLFPEGVRELGTNVVISPVMVNDNVLDVMVSPGPSADTPANLVSSPQTSYVTFINKVTTSAAGGHAHLDEPNASLNSDGSYTVTVTGTIPAGQAPVLFAYPVEQPSLFAGYLLVQALREKGIEAQLAPAGQNVDFTQCSPHYKPENVLAEHTSPPLSEAVKVILKVSQNLHASAMPYILGATLAKATSNIDQAGFDQERAFLEKGHLDLSGASQSDGAGGAPGAFFTPDFMVHFLAFMAKQKDSALFQNSLPILGRDGTLADIQPHSPAAGHVFAKSGTYAVENMLNRNLMLTGKALAGYITSANGQHLAFAFFVNRVSLPADNPEAAQEVAGQALGEIANAAYLFPSDKPSSP